MLKAFPNMSGLVIKKIKRFFNTETPTKKQKGNIKDSEKNLYLVNQVYTFAMILCHQ